jgi:hypothetical protein
MPISADTLLAMPHKDLIDLYNAESRRLAGSLEPHLVDETCKPLYIVKLLAKLPIRYKMMATELSNERAAMNPQSSGQRKAEQDLGRQGNFGPQSFSLMR